MLKADVSAILRVHLGIEIASKNSFISHFTCYHSFSFESTIQ